MLGNIDLDMSVSTFATARRSLRPSLNTMKAQCAETLSLWEKTEIRRMWQREALVEFKSIFNSRANIAFSIKKMVEEWAPETEPSRLIKLHGIDLKHYTNLDRQSAYVAAFYDLSEKLGFFCHHSIFVQMLIDSRFACRKGSEKAPHCILFGGPGSGMSHISLTVKDCLQSAEGNMFGRQITSMSRLAWAAADATKPDNPDTSMTQISLYWDDIPASFLTAKRPRDDGDDRVTTMKEMLSVSTLRWTRNIEIMNPDGTINHRDIEEMTINNESVFFGNMMCAPEEINPAFQRRVSFKTCVQFERADGVSFEAVKVKERASRDDPARVRWTAALRDNAKLHLLVATAEYCGIIEPPDLSIWNVLVEKFTRAVNEYVHFSNFHNRISDVRTRCVLLTRMIAVFETYQQEDQNLTFEQIISMLPEVEKRAIAGERLCLSVLSSLDDTVFPLMHRVILRAISVKWPDLEPAHDVFMQDGVEKGAYAVLPLSGLCLTGLTGLTDDEDAIGCAKRLISSELQATIDTFKLGGADAFVESAVEALFSVFAPDHPVLVVKVDEGIDRRMTVFVSLKRLATRDMTIDTIIRQMAKRSGGTQLMMLPYTAASGKVLPQFPAFCDHGFADGEIMDDAVFAKRCELLFLDPAESRAYHPAFESDDRDATEYPPTCVASACDRRTT